ncbi:glycosyltransferase family 39 protein [Candidatus Microgenomates bacterium]|nr:glycosyltransferase family 39 protein [Candidatus Microgenomates bacterium]
MKKILVVCLLLFFTAALLYESFYDTPTYDEPANIAAAYAYVYKNDFRIYPDNPPLVKILAGLALFPLRNSIKFPEKLETYSSPEKFDLYTFGRDFLYRSGNDAQKIILLSRLPNICLTVGLGLLLYLFAKKLSGENAGLLALLLYSLDPNIRGHGHILAFDIPLAFIIVLILYVTYRLIINDHFAKHGENFRRMMKAKLKETTCLRRQVSECGIPSLIISFLFTLGFLTKFTFLFFAVIYFFTLFLYRRRLAIYIFISSLLVSFGALWLFGILTNYNRVTLNYDKLPLIASANEQLKNNPVWRGMRGLPLPYYYKAGIMTMYTHSLAGQPAYLLGEVRIRNDWFFYFPVSFLLKVPIPTQIIIYLAMFYALKKRLRPFRYTWFFLMGFFFLLGMMFFSHINNVFRYLFPTYVLWILGASQVIFMKTKPKEAIMEKFRLRGFAALFIYLFLTSFFSFPYDLSYTNELTGIPPKGYKYLSDSEVDWGQDLGRLGKWLKENSLDKETITLSYLGTADPQYYGIKYQPLRYDMLDSLRGIVAVSVGNLTLGDWQVTGTSDYKLGLVKAPLDFLRAKKPEAVVGKSIFVYKF